MSKLTFTMKSLLAIGAATALTITASADVTKPTQPTTADAKALGSGSGAGKANFQDLSVTAKGGDDDEIEYQGGDIESEGDLALNGIAAPNDKLGPIKGESQRALKFDGVEGEAKDREPAAINAGCEPYPACARNKEAMENEIAAPIKSEGFTPVAGAALAKDSDGEDRLTENVSIASGPKGMMPEAKKDAAEKIGGDDPISGIDIIVKKRPEDR